MKRALTTTKSIIKDIVTSELFIQIMLVLCIVALVFAIYRLIDLIVIF